MLSNRNRMHGILALTLSGQTGAHRRGAQSTCAAWRRWRRREARVGSCNTRKLRGDGAINLCESAAMRTYARTVAPHHTRPGRTVRCVTGASVQGLIQRALPWLRLSLAVTVRATVSIIGKELSCLGRAGQPECQSLVVDVACAVAGEHDVIECREAGSVPLVLHVL